MSFQKIKTSSLNYIKIITKYFNSIEKIFVLNNLIVYSRQENVFKFYNEASLAVNLTNSNLAVETFGLTALEAMSAGLPVIVPTVGGIAELVDDGVNGYKIDAQDIDCIVERIDNIFTDKSLYLKLSENALSMSKKYDKTSMIDNILEILQ